MKIKIRDFTRKDSVAVFKIIKDCYENLPIGGHSPQGIMMQIDGNKPEKLVKRAETVKYIVATRDNQIVGVGGYDIIKIHTLFVARELHGFGIGQELLDRIVFKAKDEGILSLITWSTLFAQNFYEKNGFKAIREIFLPEDTKDICLVEMTKIFNK